MIGEVDLFVFSSGFVWGSRAEWAIAGTYTYTELFVFCVEVDALRGPTGWSFMLMIGHGFCISLESRIRSPEFILAFSIMTTCGWSARSVDCSVVDLGSFAIYMVRGIVMFSSWLFDLWESQ